MKRRFVVGIDGETSQDVSSFLEYIKEQEFSWWHWVDNLWLLTSYDDNIRVGSIRDDLLAICDKNLIVLEVDKVTWATYGPQGERSGDSSEDISKWIKETWST